MEIEEKIKNILDNNFIDYYGVADLRNYKEYIVSFGGEVLGQYPNAISIGITQPHNIVDGLKYNLHIGSTKKRCG